MSGQKQQNQKCCEKEWDVGWKWAILVRNDTDQIVPLFNYRENTAFTREMLSLEKIPIL